MDVFADRKIMAWILLAGLSVTSAYINDYDAPMEFSCHGQTTLRRLYSSHDNAYEDRRWSVGCYNTPASIQNCQWTGYVNEFDQPFAFDCPGNGFINGVRSVHDNEKEDRRWAFKCCEMQGRSRRNCRNTDFVNSFDGVLSYTTAQPYQNFHGWISVHHDDYEDRIFAFHLCDYVEAN